MNIFNPTAEQDAYVKTEYDYTRRYIQQLHDDIDAGSSSLGRPLNAANEPSSKSPPHHPHASPSNETTKPTPTTPAPTLIIHLGQASYCNDPPSLGLERLAFSQSMRSSWWNPREAQQGYHRIPDDKGETIDDVDEGRDPWAAKDVPVGLSTALDIDQVAIYARAALRTTPTLLSRQKEEDKQSATETPSKPDLMTLIAEFELHKAQSPESDDKTDPEPSKTKLSNCDNNMETLIQKVEAFYTRDLQLGRHTSDVVKIIGLFHMIDHPDWADWVNNKRDLLFAGELTDYQGLADEAIAEWRRRSSVGYVATGDKEGKKKTYPSIPPRRAAFMSPSNDPNCYIHGDKHKDSQCYMRHLEVRLNQDTTDISPHQSRLNITTHKPSHLNITTHHEAGPYLCGFIYYESLAQCYTRQKRADVLFCHVPAMLGEDEVIEGRDAVVAVVEGGVRWLIEQKEREACERVDMRGVEVLEVTEIDGSAGNNVEDVM